MVFKLYFKVSMKVYQSVLFRVCGIGDILIGKRVGDGAGGGEALLFYRNTDDIQKLKNTEI